MKRKFQSRLFLAALMAMPLCSCKTKSDTLLFLNWGEYIDETMITAFEKEYNCTVQMDLGESNEIFYSKAKAGTTVYDVICPSDYMVEKMYANDLLEKLDWSKLPNVTSRTRKNSIIKIFNEMDQNLKQNLGDDYVTGTISDYAVPYLSGTWGIMYSTKKEGLEEAVTENENQWAALFDRSLLPSDTKVAMYDSHQHDYYAVCKYLGWDNTKELPQSDLDRIENLIANMKYDAWGTDSIKKDIVAGNIDVGYMWTGDFLYYYAENAANVTMKAYLNGDLKIDETNDFIDTITSKERVAVLNGNRYEIGFDFYIPDDTVAFSDNLVITKDSANKDLAYKFINFMLSSSEKVNGEEINPAFTNTYYVDYDAPYADLYNELVDLKNNEFTSNMEEVTSFHPNSGDPYDSDLYWAFYDYAIGIGFAKYYEPADSENPKGNILAMFDRKYVNRINTTFNNARV